MRLRVSGFPKNPRETLNALGVAPCAGNYSDGNLVATLLSHYLNVTQCTIAHALEKTKYDDADIYWWGHPLHTTLCAHPAGTWQRWIELIWP